MAPGWLSIEELPKKLGTLNCGPLIQIKQTALGKATMRGRVARRPGAQTEKIILSEQMHPAAPRRPSGALVPDGAGHALLLRIQALLLPIKTLVLSGH
jgi:hypothetical protein